MHDGRKKLNGSSSVCLGAHQSRWSPSSHARPPEHPWPPVVSRVVWRNHPSRQMPTQTDIQTDRPSAHEPEGPAARQRSQPAQPGRQGSHHVEVCEVEDLRLVLLADRVTLRHTVQHTHQQKPRRLSDSGQAGLRASGSAAARRSTPDAASPSWPARRGDRWRAPLPSRDRGAQPAARAVAPRPS